MRMRMTQEVRRQEAARVRVFRAADGYYAGWELADGSHHQRPGRSKLQAHQEAAALREAILAGECDDEIAR